MADYAYYTPDHLGSVRGMRLQDRSLSGSYAYEPYGQTRAASGLPLNVGYTGHLWDATIQQYFAPFRYYNPAAARWTMRDPLGMVDGPNMYGYVKARPLRYKDAFGMYHCTYSICTHRMTCKPNHTPLKPFDSDEFGSGTDKDHPGGPIPGPMNNPDETGNIGHGPLPEGDYDILRPKPGDPTRRPLGPRPGNVMKGRAGFQIHRGSHPPKPRDSQGCIVAPPRTLGNLYNLLKAEEGANTLTVKGCDN
jgi:RHS repeat-associated protein